MKLTYTEFRPTVNRSTVEDLGDVTDDADFLTAVLGEIKTCMENDAQDVAHKLLDWHRAAIDGDRKPGLKLVHHYGTGLDPVGTWEITK